MAGYIVVAALALVAGFAWGAYWAARYIETRPIASVPEDVQ